VIVFFLSHCTLRPYQAPEVAPANLSQADEEWFATQTYDPSWWKLFDDPVLVIVAAEVARNYFELRALQQQFAVAERTLANQRETLRLTQCGVMREWEKSSTSCVRPDALLTAKRAFRQSLRARRA
jgi:hypothetical protein